MFPQRLKLRKSPIQSDSRERIVLSGVAYDIYLGHKILRIMFNV